MEHFDEISPSMFEVSLLDTHMNEDMLDAFVAGAVVQLLLLAKQDEQKAVRWRERQKAGIASARERGTHLGRPLIKIPKNFEALVKQWEKGSISFDELLKRTGLKQATFYRRLRELRKRKEK